MDGLVELLSNALVDALPVAVWLLEGGRSIVEDGDDWAGLDEATRRERRKTAAEERATARVLDMLPRMRGGFDDLDAMMQRLIEEQVEAAGLASLSHVIPYHKYKSSCGYCKRGKDIKESSSFGLVAEKLTCADYETMINRGWRRAGTWCYKPQNSETCCPQYAIRLNVHDFFPDRQQRGSVRKMERFVLTRSTRAQDPPHSETAQEKSKPKADESTVALVSGLKVCIDSLASSGRLEWFTPEFLRSFDPILESLSSSMKPIQTKMKNISDQARWSSTFCQVALGAAKRQRLPLNGDGLTELSTLLAHEWQSQLPLGPGVALFPLRGFLNFMFDEVPQESAVEVVENSQPQPSLKRLLGATVTCEVFPADFTVEKFALFNKYQQSVHKDEPGKNKHTSFFNFLVKSPLVLSVRPPPAHQFDIPTFGGVAIPPYPGQGTFHAHYRVDGKLVAVSVLDVLPSCVSSVYLFYDPDFAFLSLGKFTCLFEIEVTKHWSQIQSSLNQYWLGYYVHECPKMRYKADFRPCELLDPITFQFLPFDDTLRAGLDSRKFFSFTNPEAQASDLDEHEKWVSEFSEDWVLQVIETDAVIALKTADDEDSEDDSSDSDEEIEDGRWEGPPESPKCQVVRWSGLTEHGQQLIQPKVQEWVKRSGLDLARRAVIVFQ